MSKVTVLMPCYNAGKFLAPALESVIGQTYKDLEIIVTDDCSTDDTLRTIRDYAEKDHRIKVVRNPVNLGLIRSLNNGIDLATGELIARMDQDDICFPDRIEKQVAVLEEDPGLGLVASRWIVIDENGRELGKNLPRTFSSKSNLFESFFGPPFGHSSVMMRAAVLREYYYRYSEHTKHIEDYDTWARMLMGGVKTRVMNDVLLKYRHFEGNTTHTFARQQDKNMLFCAAENLESFLSVTLKPRIHKIVLNRQDVDIDKHELAEGIREFKRVKELFIAVTKPNANELRDIEYLASNHVSDLLIQYLLKNRKPSRMAAGRLALENLGSIANFRNARYIVQKFFARLHRRNA